VASGDLRLVPEGSSLPGRRIGHGSGHGCACMGQVPISSCGAQNERKSGLYGTAARQQTCWTGSAATKRRWPATSPRTRRDSGRRAAGVLFSIEQA
jgi:hypothetical protein